MTHSTLSRTFFSFLFFFFFENEVCHTHTHETTDNIWLALLDKESIYIYISLIIGYLRKMKYLNRDISIERNYNC